MFKISNRQSGGLSGVCCPVLLGIKLTVKIRNFASLPLGKFAFFYCEYCIIYVNLVNSPKVLPSNL